MIDNLIQSLRGVPQPNYERVDPFNEPNVAGGTSVHQMTPAAQEKLYEETKQRQQQWFDTVGAKTRPNGPTSVDSLPNSNDAQLTREEKKAREQADALAAQQAEEYRQKAAANPDINEYR